MKYTPVWVRYDTRAWHECILELVCKVSLQNVVKQYVRVSYLYRSYVLYLSLYTVIFINHIQTIPPFTLRHYVMRPKVCLILTLTDVR